MAFAANAPSCLSRLGHAMSQAAMRHSADSDASTGQLVQATRSSCLLSYHATLMQVAGQASGMVPGAGMQAIMACLCPSSATDSCCILSADATPSISVADVIWAGNDAEAGSAGALLFRCVLQSARDVNDMWHAGMLPYC